MTQSETLVCLLETYARIRPCLVDIHRRIAMECSDFSLIRNTEWLIDEVDRCIHQINCPEIAQKLYEIQRKIAAEAKV
jgi:hypothetical protein